MTTKRTIRTPKTAEQRAAEARELQATIAGAVERLRSSDAWAEYLKLLGTFHRYSLNNVLLIWSQNPHATRVAGFGTWKKLGRQVRKGSKGIRIFAGFSVALEVENPDTGDTEEQRFTRFKPCSIFDVSQTDPIFPDKPDLPTVTHLLTGADQPGIYGAVEDFLTGLGWTVTREQLPGTENGYTTCDGSRRVVISTGLEPAHAAKTILHEAAHVLLHTEETITDREYVEHRGERETAAESVAYVVAGLLGLDTSDFTIGYVAGWSHGDTELIRRTASDVHAAVKTITDAICKTTDDQEEDQS